MTASITTHVLDLTLGQPARRVGVILSFFNLLDGRWDDLGHSLTDPDGRVRDLLEPGTPLAAGTYQLDFDTGAYFQGRGVPAFYPRVVIHFEVTDPTQHHHVPLLLSPYGYSTYRGS